MEFPLWACAELWAKLPDPSVCHSGFCQDVISSSSDFSALTSGRVWGCPAHPCDSHKVQSGRKCCCHLRIFCLLGATCADSRKCPPKLHLQTLELWLARGFSVFHLTIRFQFQNEKEALRVKLEPTVSAACAELLGLCQHSNLSQSNGGGKAPPNPGH